MKSLFSSRKVDVERALAPAPDLSVIVQASTRPHQQRSVRKNVWCVCTLVLNGADLREAVIIDVSKSGARLRFRVRGQLPPVVRIQATRLGLNRMADVVWQDTYNAGLRFLPSSAV